MLSFNVFKCLNLQNICVILRELSVANHYLTSRDGMFVCFQGILLNTLSEFLRKMEKYKAFPRPHSTCDCINRLNSFHPWTGHYFHVCSLFEFTGLLTQNKMLSSTNYVTFLLRRGSRRVLVH